MRGVNNPLPEGWLELPIAEVADVSLGKTPKKSHYANEGKIRLIKFRDVTEDGLNLSETKDAFVKDEPDAIKGLQPVQKGDVLLTASAHSPQYIGRKVAIVDELPEGFDYFYVGELLNIRPHNGIDPRWITGYLRSEQGYQNIQAHVHGMHLTSGRAYNILIRIAPLKYMQTAIKAMDALQERSRRVRKALAEVGPLLEQFRQSVSAAAFRGDLTADWRVAHPDIEPANELLRRIRAERRRCWEHAELAQYEVKGQKPPKNWTDKYEEPEPVDDTDLPELPEGWCWARFDEVLSELRNGVSPKPNDTPPGTPILRINSVRSRKVLLDELRYLPNADSYVKTYHLRDRDLLFTRYNGSLELLGVCGLVQGLRDRVILYPDKLMRVRIEHQLVLPEFIEMYFASPDARQRVTSKAKTTSGQQGVSGADIKAQPIPLAPLSEQQQLVIRLQAILTTSDEHAAALLETHEELDQLNQSILAKAFRGALMPQDPNDEPASVLLARIREQRAQQAEATKGTKKTTTMQRRDAMRKKLLGLSSSYRPLVEVLTTKGKPMLPQQLLTEAGYDDDSIEDFYSALREEIAKGRIQENRLTESDVVLEAVKQ